MTFDASDALFVVEDFAPARGVAIVAHGEIAILADLARRVDRRGLWFGRMSGQHEEQGERDNGFEVH
jgi:hypothetical protein